MKLFEVPRDTIIRVPDSGEQLHFVKIDGMYSLCIDQTGEPVHLAAWTEVEIVKPAMEKA